MAPCAVISDRNSFVLCDSNADGFPIRYVSRGFEELYGYSAEECAGKRCGVLVGGASVLSKSAERLEEAASCAHLTREEAADSINLMTAAVSEKLRKVVEEAEAGKSLACAGPFLLVNRRKSGELFVCEMALQRNVHPRLGWSYDVGIQRDVSAEITVEKLLLAAAKGQTHYSAMCSNRTRGVSLPLLLASRASVDHFHETAGKMWRESLISGMGMDGTGSKKCRAQSADEEFEDARSLSSLSTACSLNAGTRKKVPAHAGSHHLGAFAGTIMEAEATFSERFIDLLERPDGIDDDEEKENALCSNVMVPPFLTQQLQLLVAQVSREELLKLDIALVLVYPSNENLPVVLCSRGFEKFVGAAAKDIVGQDARTGCVQLSSSIVQAMPSAYEVEVRRHCKAFWAAALTGSFFPGDDQPGCAIFGGSLMKLPAGELAFLNTRVVKGGDTLEVVYLKQVELDDGMFVVGLVQKLRKDLTARIIRSDIDSIKERLCLQAFQQLEAQLDSVVALLGSEFFYSAPLRRQVAAPATDSRSEHGCARL